MISFLGFDWFFMFCCKILDSTFFLRQISFEYFFYLHLLLPLFEDEYLVIFFNLLVLMLNALVSIYGCIYRYLCFFVL